ncbi:hypothetical protein ACHAWF_011426 [Thalassiosira exigua]
MHGSFLRSMLIISHVNAFMQSVTLRRCLSKQPRLQEFIRTTSVQARPKSKWDDLADEDDEGGLNNENTNVSPDMLYTEVNIRRQASTYDQLEALGGKDLINDVYVRAPGEREWWLVGKVAHVSDVSPEQAIERQWPLIERHVWALRIPVRPTSNLSTPFEVWYAPGDTELEAARNNPKIQFSRVSNVSFHGGANVNASFVGFVGKAYNEQRGEPFFFVERNVIDGSCLREREIPGDWLLKSELNDEN